tara:strand:- start:1575 stop:2159 length:585 start_codon:yes stop_codon:yes gene_type:complete
MKRVFTVCLLVSAGFGATADEPVAKFERGGFAKKEVKVYGMTVEETRKGDKDHSSSIQPPVLNLELQAKFTEKAAVGNPDACNVDASISYMHLGSDIQVDTTIDNEVCAASHGNYTIRIKTVRNGEDHIESITEPWERKNDSPITITKYYAMQDDADLSWVRIRTDRKTGCLCINDAAGEAGLQEMSETGQQLK